MDESPSGTWGPRPLPDCGPDKWVRFGRWKGILALMWFYSTTLWIYIPANSIMVSSKKNNDLHVTERNWKSLSSSSSLKALGFAPNRQAFLKWCALDDFQQRSGPFICRLGLGQLLFCNDGCKSARVPAGFLVFWEREPPKHLGGGWTLQSFPVWRPSLPVNLLRHTEPAAVPFKQQPLRSNFHVNKCSQVGVAMAISPWLPWRRDWGGTGSRFAVDSWSPFFCPLPFPLSLKAKPHLLEPGYKSATCVHLQSCVTQRNWIVHKSPSIWPEVLTHGSLRLRGDARRCKSSDGAWALFSALLKCPSIINLLVIKCALYKRSSYLTHRVSSFFRKLSIAWVSWCLFALNCNFRLLGWSFFAQAFIVPAWKTSIHGSMANMSV